MYSFIDNTQKKLYNEDRFYAVKQREVKNVDELNKHNIDDANTENCAPEESTENQQPTMAVGTDAQETKQVAEKNTAAPEVNTDKLICPRCGKAFDQKEKKCPHCGLKNNLKLCKTCGATIAKNAKRCPKCGAKNPKPIYKRVWFWIIVLVAVLFINSKLSSLGKDTESDKASNTVTEAVQEQETPTPISAEEEALIGRWSATKLFKLNEKKAGDMEAKDLEVEFNVDHTGRIESQAGGTTSFEWSYDGTTDKGDIVFKAGNVTVAIIGDSGNMREYAGDLMMTSDSDSVFILERQSSKNTSTSTKTADTPKTSKVVSSKISVGKQNALHQANQYLDAMAFSYSGLVEQLEYEGYSTEDATYAVDHCGADWNEQAAKKAEEYLNTMSFSRSGLVEQLEYEGFTHDQAVYGANKAY